MIWRSDNLDVFWNLAAEEWLLNTPDVSPPILFLWRSRPAVVIGKNQDPWQECPVDDLARQQVPVARRVSGGGAVYLDEGTLNFAVILPRAAWNSYVFSRLPRQALQTWNLCPDCLGKNGLALAGRKFSGQAFCLQKRKFLHHGTLLVAADLGRLQASLRPTAPRRTFRAVPSHPAPVINLRDAAPAITVAGMEAALQAAWTMFEPHPETGTLENTPEIARLRVKHAGTQWRLGRWAPPDQDQPAGAAGSAS